MTVETGRRLIERLIRETEDWRSFHRGRGKNGQIEVLACNIRLKALKDSLAVEPPPPTPKEKA